MKSIGGFFEIEFSNILLNNLHQDSIKLNTARNCLEYILLANGYKKVYVPFYTCNVILEPIQKHGLGVVFYNIDENLEPVFDFNMLDEQSCFVYNNYYGIKNGFIENGLPPLRNIIIDNSQALFSPRFSGFDTFYSLRKFVGTADGAFLYSENKIDEALIARDSSSVRLSHLYERKDHETAGSGYQQFKENDASLSQLPLLAMTQSTAAFLNAYDFEKNKLTRERNFLFIHDQLSQYNKLNISVTGISGPLCYPLWIEGGSELKAELIRKNIFVPTYWPGIRAFVGWDNFPIEDDLINNLVCLPIDQRYTLEDMGYIVNNISK